VSSIIDAGQKFIMRLASNVGKTVITDKNGNVVKLRHYSFTLPSGEVETLLTNIDPQEMSDDALADLYMKRWGIETKYLELKDRLQINEFSGECVNTVLQDIYATLYISNLTAFICFEADEAINQESSASKHERKAKRSVCIAALRTRFVDLCLLDNPLMRDAALARLVEDLKADVTYIGKSKPRPRTKNRFQAAKHRKVKTLL